ncbi:MAG TPA: tetratricopeptide repeat protein [Kofleriaceae bacterium]|nr:tetratricopeptide repeat protein [Kofleriaceae bacterium]
MRIPLAIAVMIGCSSRSSDKPQPTPSPAPQHDAAADAASSLGALAFPLTEGTPEARAHFNRGLLALHSFWYDEATRAFEAAIAADPTMNMAYWGLAMSYCKLLWGEDDVVAAKAALKRMPDPERLSPREQMWVTATIQLLKADDAHTGRKEFARSLQLLHENFPDDESATWLAIALLSSSRPQDLDNLALRHRAGELAAGVYAKNPLHPGAAHYLIHAYDTPELAKEALPYARAYAKIAPEAPHARHMPAHIYTRLGLWPEAITSCKAAWDASVAAATAAKLSADHDDFHSLTWLVEMSFEVGRRSDADGYLKLYADAVRAGIGRTNRALYATEVASYMMRTGEWSRVDDLLAPLAAAATSDAGSHCAAADTSSPPAMLEQLAALDARARAAAWRHDVASTKRLANELDALRTKLRPFMESTQPPQVLERTSAAQARLRRALLARAANNDRALLAVLRESAADAESEVGGESNPSAFAIGDDIGDVLMRLAQPKDALAEYEHVLAKHPQRARSLLGAARAAKQAKEIEKSRGYYEQLRALWKDADPTTDALAEVRAPE